MSFSAPSASRVPCPKFSHQAGHGNPVEHHQDRGEQQARDMDARLAEQQGVQDWDHEEAFEEEYAEDYLGQSQLTMQFVRQQQNQMMVQNQHGAPNPFMMQGVQKAHGHFNTLNLNIRQNQFLTQPTAQALLKAMMQNARQAQHPHPMQFVHQTSNQVMVQNMGQNQHMIQGGHHAQNQVTAQNFPGRSRVPLPATMHGVPVTTLLVKNLCRKLSQDDVLQLWPQDVHHYNFFYAVYDLSKHRHSGRVLINFSCHSAAVAFYEAWDGVQHLVLSARDDHDQLKFLKIETSFRQSFLTMLEHFGETLYLTVPAELYPAVFDGAQRVDFLHAVNNPPIIQL